MTSAAHTEQLIRTDIRQLADMVAESGPDGGMDGELSFFILMHCERLCDRLRLHLQQTGILTGFDGPPG